MDLGAPIGTHTSKNYDNEGLGSGITSNTGHQNASSGVQGTGSTPIADRFTSGNNSSSYASGGNSGYTSGNTYSSDNTTGYTSGNTGYGQGESAVSGQYAGGATGDALTGESHASRTGAGVGPLGENLDSGVTSGTTGHHHHHHHHHHSQQQEGYAGDYTPANTRGQGEATDDNSSSNYRSSAPLTKETPEAAAGYGTGVGAQGGAGGHYSRDDDVSRSQQYGSGVGVGAGVGAAAGAGAVYGADEIYDSSRGQTQGQGQYQSSGQYGQNQTSTGQFGQSQTTDQGQTHTGEIGKPGQGSNLDPTDGSGGAGHYGRANEDDFNRGAPLSNPKDIDTGGPHSLVFQESTGKYVHRRDL